MSQEEMTIEEFKRARGEWTPAKGEPGPQKGPASLGQIRAQTAMVNRTMSEGDIGRITLWLPKLPRATHPNSRPHWAAKAKAAKGQRIDAWAAAKAVMGLAKPWAAAEVQVTYFTYRPICDRDNILAWLKSSFDAFEGVIVDNDSAFTYLPVVITRVKAHEACCGTIRITITRTA